MAGIIEALANPAGKAIIPAGDLDLPGRILLLAIRIVTTSIAAALYYDADLGVSTYDAIPLHIADKKPRIAGRILQFKVIRIISDLVCVLIGFLLGMMPGIGTVVTALFMGPLITFFRRTISGPLLHFGAKENSTN